MNSEYQLKRSLYVTVVGAVVNSALSLLKIAAGLILNVNAIFADGIHSLSDLVLENIKEENLL